LNPMRQIVQGSASPMANLFYYSPRLRCYQGKPSGEGWITGEELLLPFEGRFQHLLTELGHQMNTTNRKIIAASFALRYGWSAGVPIGIYMTYGKMVDVSVCNISLKFSSTSLYENYSFHDMNTLETIMGEKPVDATTVASELYKQTAPIVQELHTWSRFSKRAIWSMIVSSWSSQCIDMAESALDDRNLGYELAEKILRYNPDLYKNKPVFYSVQHGETRRIFHKRYGCCLYYIGPDRGFCTSCPLIDDEERAERSYQYLREMQCSETEH